MSSAATAGASENSMPPAEEGGRRVKFNRPWVEASYYDPRDPHNVKALFGLENNDRLRINDPTNPHHKTPAPQPRSKNRNLLKLIKFRKERYEIFKQYMRDNEGYWITQLGILLNEMNSSKNNRPLAISLFHRWFAHLITGVDEHHLELYERVRKENPQKFKEEILNEILSPHVLRDKEAENKLAVEAAANPAVAAAAAAAAANVAEYTTREEKIAWQKRLMAQLNSTRNVRERDVKKQGGGRKKKNTCKRRTKRRSTHRKA